MTSGHVGVDGLQLPGLGFFVHVGRNAVRGEHDDGPLGHLVGLFDEHRAGLGQRVDDVAVVHDLVADVDRRAVLLQSTFDGLHRAVHAGAVAARLGQQDPLTRVLRETRTQRGSAGAWNPHVDSRRHESRVLIGPPASPSRRLSPWQLPPYGVRLMVGAAVTAIEETRKLRRRS